MEEPYHAYTKSPNPSDKEADTRKLKRLRVLLILWFVSFVATLLWFSFSPSL